MRTKKKSVGDESNLTVDEQAASIRKHQDRLNLRGLLLAGASSAPAAPADAGYFADLRDRVRLCNLP